MAHNGELLQRLYADLLGLPKPNSLTIQSEKVLVGQTLKTCIGAIRLDAALGVNRDGKRVEDDLSVHADP